MMLNALIVSAAIALLSACANNGSSPQVTTGPSGSNGTTHGAPKNGMASGPDAATH
jgi:hypothetical protein